MSLIEAISPTTAAILERQRLIDETAEALGEGEAVRRSLAELTFTRLKYYHTQAMQLNRSSAPTETDSRKRPAGLHQSATPGFRVNPHAPDAAAAEFLGRTINE